MHLTSDSHLLSLSDFIRQSIFEDALNSYTNACLVGPPTVEFAPYGRTPGGRRRVDARAGTIDQDPEFMAFLEGLANPTNGKEANGENSEAGEAPTKGVKVTTTPLVQYLKDKKASRTKEAAVKAAKKQEAQVAKNKTAKDAAASPADDPKKKTGKDVKTDRLVEKAAREAVKILNRETASKASSSATSNSKPEAAGADNASPPKLDLSKAAGTRNRGAAISAHIRMLQRDLGLTPAQAHRQVRRDTADAQKAERIAAAAAAAAAGSAETQAEAERVV